MWTQLVNAFLLSVAVATLAFWRGSLSGMGALGAIVVGTLTFGLGGWQWGVLLGLFFVSSSLLSHFKEEEKRTAAEKFDKGHQRDMGQVLATGGLGAALAVLSFVVPSPVWGYLFMGVMATVTADTWATELGTLSKQPPRLITSRRVVAVGTSGGVSLLGTVISLVGGVLIGLAAVVGYTRALALELGPEGVCVNAIAPGAIPTRAERVIEDRAAYDQQVIDAQCLKRRGSEEEIAATVLFLCSRAGGFVTGQTLLVDGGLNLRWTHLGADNTSLFLKDQNFREAISRI
jgi:uncharacterized protein (TIGR00297 family)